MKESSFYQRLGHLCLAAFTALAGLGISGCGNGYDPPHPPMPMYGVPTATIHGTVKQSDGTPIQGIKVTVNATVVHNNENILMPLDTTTTAGDGTYTLHPRANVGQYEVDAVDMDGAENGGDFASGTDNIDSLSSKQTAKADFTLLPKE